MRTYLSRSGLHTVLCLLAACGGGEVDKPDDELQDSAAVVDSDGTGTTGTTGDDTAGSELPPGCGDGVLDPGELCDDGPGNSDTAPDACRSDCTPARCGDGVADSDEACDDGNTASADGCSAECAVESEVLEVEPNDSWDTAQALSGPGTVLAALPEGDVDCFSLPALPCGAITAEVAGDCPGPLAMTLHGPDGAVTAAGSPLGGECGGIDPAEAAGARFLAEGDWAVCMEAATEGTSASALSVTLSVQSADDAGFELPTSEDPDGDGVPDQCDDDDDGDGIPDDDDDCPDIGQGPDALPFSVSDGGFIRQWLAAGPYTGTSSTSRCRPSDDTLVHPTDDALATPALTDAAGSLIWTVLSSDADRIEFLDRYGGVGAPREVYTAVWVRGTAGTATLALGPDDGARAWFDGAEVLDIDGCQGTNVDQFQAEVTLSGDWQLLLIKVRDQGGGWGNYARFLDGDGRALTGLSLALTPDGSGLPDADSDGDGTGDACDPTPL